jgi:DNA-binding NarL/FixJ family response regulator
MTTRPSGEVVGRAADGAAAVTLASESRPDIVLVDLNVHYGGGIRTVSAIRPRFRMLRS